MPGNPSPEEFLEKNNEPERLVKLEADIVAHNMGQATQYVKISNVAAAEKILAAHIKKYKNLLTKNSFHAIDQIR